MLSTPRQRLCPTVLVLALAAPVFAEITIDFDDLAVGTIVATQYDGVTFSAQPQPGSCGGVPPINPIIVNPAGSTSSGLLALSLSPGCDFSPEYLRIDFDVGQSEVTFILGGDTTPGTYELRGYTTADVEFSVPDVVIPAGASGVNRFVRITRAAGNMGRIEIEDSIGEFEIIDDLTYSSDGTPPTADITSPLFQECVCGIVGVQGVACDNDGDYGFDKLEYRAVDAPPGVPWTQIGMFTTPLCDEGTLYNWNTAAVAGGWYTLLLTVENANGLRAQDSVVVLVDKQFSTVTVRSPLDGAILGGAVCVDGTVWDHCLDHYTVEYRTVGGGAFSPVDPLTPQYDSAVVNDGLATWDTTALADGDYELRVRGEDTCGNFLEDLRVVAIDNTEPDAAITEPLACKFVNGIVSITGTADDAHLDRYELQYIGGAATDWTDIVPPSVVPVEGGLLGDWDTDGLEPCAYTIRLVVYEETIIDCCGRQGSRTIYLPVDVGLCCDINRDGAGDGLDVQPFTDCILDAVCP